MYKINIALGISLLLLRMTDRNPLDSYKVYLKFALELDSTNIPVAYACRMQYVTLAIEAFKAHPELKTQQLTADVSTIMKKIGEMKQIMRNFIK